MRSEKVRARSLVAKAVGAGRLSPASSLECFDCHGPARDYDHYAGYDESQALNVQAVCRACHVARAKSRGEYASGERHWSRHKPERLVRGDGHASSKLTSTVVLRILEEAETGVPTREIARRHAISRSQVRRIATGDAWAHVKKAREG